MWGGNPCQFIKDLDVAEAWSNYTLSYVNHFLGDAHCSEFTLWNSAYLHYNTTQEDLVLDQDNAALCRTSAGLMKGVAKYYA